jgi:hypothetical protein
MISKTDLFFFSTLCIESPINQEVAVKRKGRGFKAGDATEPMEVDGSSGQVIYERLDDQHQKEKEQTAGNAARCSFLLLPSYHQPPHRTFFDSPMIIQ